MAQRGDSEVVGAVSPTAHDIDVEKRDSTSKHLECDEHEEKQQTRGDYSGAVAKSTPEEVKLVRKLDLWIMVRHFDNLTLPQTAF